MRNDTKPPEIRAHLEALLGGARWSQSVAKAFMGEVMRGAVAPELLACALGALRVRGETACEVAGFAAATREAAVRVALDRPVFDLVGTGGDGAGTFNISTTAAILCAAAGVPMAKHGNRSISSRSGSADVLEALGIPTTLDPDGVREAIATHGFAFLFAPRYHPGFRHAAPVRRALKVRTVFNMLGPLVNPASPKASVIGVYSAAIGRLAADALVRSGMERALVVHGAIEDAALEDRGFEDDGAGAAAGLDEWTLTGPNRVWEIRGGAVTAYEILPEDLGFARAPIAALQGGDADENAATTRAILAGKEIGPRRDVVLLNAGALLWIAGEAANHKDGIALARAAIDDGRAAAKLAALAS